MCPQFFADLVSQRLAADINNPDADKELQAVYAASSLIQRLLNPYLDSTSIDQICGLELTYYQCEDRN